MAAFGLPTTDILLDPVSASDLLGLEYTEILSVASHHDIRDNTIVVWLEILHHAVLDAHTVVRLPNGFVLGFT